MKIGVYVGSFNPPHHGHINVINYLLNHNHLDKIIVIPTEAYWDKTDLIDIKYRIKMLKIYENDKIIIDDELNKLPYTYQVLNSLKEKYSNDELMLIIGDDNLPKFHLWKNYQEILENKVIVLKRNNININDTVAYNYSPNSFVIINDFLKIDISSTKVRSLLQEEDYKEVKKYLDNEVLDYIINNKLYQEEK